MKFKSILLLAVAVGCGLVAMVGVQQVLTGPKDSNSSNVTPVLVATSEVPPGTPLDDTNTMFKNWPSDAIPPGAVTKKEEYEERAYKVAMVPGEIVMKTKLGEKGVFGASTDIPSGMRVVTVPVNLTKTHSGLIMPGDRVDVIVTYKARVQNEQVSKAKTVLEFIKVFATDNLRRGDVTATEAGDMHVKNISLLVTPEQANLLMLAETKGQLTLALRHKTDSDTAYVADITDFDFENSEVGKGDTKDDSIANDNAAAIAELKKLFDQSQENAKTAVANTVVPTWPIRIYEGSELRVENVELPPGEADDANNETNTVPGASRSEAGRLWKGLLQKFLLGA